MADIRKQIHTDIESQFPAIYREDGELFVRFMEAYYEYLDSQANNFREAPTIRDIDRTYGRFLIYFKEKYLKDFPSPPDLDARFMIKHIQDLYRRKGTEESLRLAFQIFFEEEIEVFYPSTAILKPSDSKYGSSNYLELKPVQSRSSLDLRKGDRIRGSTSKATAFVDELIFLTIEAVTVPIVYMTNVNGTFAADDAIEVYRPGLTNPLFPGKIIYGSINNISVTRSNRSAGNKVGDILKIRSSLYGKDATCIVTSISETSTGIIDFAIEDGGWGYSANTNLNELFISDQVIVIEAANNFTIGDLDTLVANNSPVEPLDPASNTVYTETVSGTGTIIKYEHPLIYLYVDSANNAFDILPFGGKTSLYVNGDANNSVTATNISTFNNSAQYSVAELTEIENVIIIPDVIGDFVNVTLDSTDYGMSGSGQETISTTLKDAFTPINFDIGSISKLNVLDTGADYRNDVASLIYQNEIVKFDKRDIGIVFDRSDFLLEVGDRITQEIEIEDLTYQANTVSYTVKADFIRREGDVFYFRQKSFYDFDRDLPVNLKNNQYNIVGISEDFSKPAMGKNADISGAAFFAIGQVDTVRVLNTGFRYRDGESVELLNANNEVVARATISVKGQGSTEADWKTTTSFLNDPTKLIRDNFYYQEYSYDISSILNPSRYEKLIADNIQVAGTKQFSSPLINSINDFQSNVDMALEIYDIAEQAIEVESNNVTVGVLSATANNVIIGDLIAVIETLGEDNVYIDLEQQ